MHDWAKTVSTALLSLAGRLMPGDHAQWLDAMRAELHHIDGPGDKLAFAGGCVMASFGRAIANGGAERSIRVLMVPALLVWVGMKSYLWLVLPSERLVPLASEMIAVSALGYACAAIWLINRNPLAALGSLTVPLIANVFHFGITARVGYLDEMALLSLALVAEEFAIWIATALGLTIILIAPKLRAAELT